LVAGLKNPAGETFKGAKMTKGNFIPEREFASTKTLWRNPDDELEGKSGY
jgi:hypothetical protein